MTAMLALVTIEEVSGPGGIQLIQAGRTINDAGVQAAYVAAGGFLAPATDPVLGPQAAIVQKARNRGANEDTCSRLMLAALAYSPYSGVSGGATQRQSLVLNLAAIKALTSGTAFNVGAALPTNAVLLGAQATWTAVTGGSLSDVELVIGDATTANSVMTTQNVHSGSSNATVSTFQNRSAVQIQAKLTATGDTLANATAGAVTIDLYFSVQANPL